MGDRGETGGRKATAAMAAAGGKSAASGLARGAAARAAERAAARELVEREGGEGVQAEEDVRRWRLPAVLMVFRCSYEAHLDGEVVVRTEDVCGDDL